jgi:hypothetical protein
MIEMNGLIFVLVVTVAGWIWAWVTLLTGCMSGTGAITPTGIRLQGSDECALELEPEHEPHVSPAPLEPGAGPRLYLVT